MSEIVRTIKGSAVGRGIITKEGNYIVYEFLDIKMPDGRAERVANVATNPNMAYVVEEGAAFQFVDGRKLNNHYTYNFLVGLQKKKGDILVDDRLMQYCVKTRFFLAYLSLIPPFTLIAGKVFKSANRLKAAHEQLGLFDPISVNFIAKTTTKKF